MAYFTAGCDEAKVMKEFAESMKLDYPILGDGDKSVAKAYGVVTKSRPVPHRWTFYIDKEGKILHIDKKVKVRSAGEDIAAKLKELGVDEKKASG